MDVLKKGTTGEKVVELQKRLNKKGFQLIEDGIFGNDTYKAVKAFQSQNLDKNGRPLVVDGKVGALTWWSLTNAEPIAVHPTIDYSKMPDVSLGGSDIGRKALREAINEMKRGAREIGGNNSGEFVAKYLEPAGLVPPQSWCASFVSWCFLQAVGGNKNDLPFKYSPGARDILSRFKRKGWAYKLNDDSGKIPEPGDIIVWWRGKITGWMGHIGLVHHFSGGFVYTIEGNRSSKVEGFDYVATRIDRLLGFGRVEL